MAQVSYDSDDVERVERSIRALERENDQLKDVTSMSNKMSIFAGSEAGNLIQYQLDLSEEKEKIDHLLRGHELKRDAEGNEYWAEPSDPLQKSLTNYGVEKLMNIVNFYLSRNIILSNYDNETIMSKMKDIGWEISDTVFLEYEFIFYKPRVKDFIERDKKLIKAIIDKYPKPIAKKKILHLIKRYDSLSDIYFRKNCRQYSIICRMLIDAIHSAYNRALNGEERASLRKAMMVHQNQSDPINQMYGMPKYNQPKRSLINPISWFR